MAEQVSWCLADILFDSPLDPILNLPHNGEGQPNCFYLLLETIKSIIIGASSLPIWDSDMIVP
jgi:hypothetical protein